MKRTFTAWAVRWKYPTGKPFFASHLFFRQYGDGDGDGYG